MRAVLIGGSGGIGSALVELLQKHPAYVSVTVFNRPELDLLDEASIELAAESISQPIDLLIVATGILHDAETLPEKSLKDLDTEKFQRLFAVNTIGPMLVAKHFLPKMAKDKRAVFAVLSARVGSINDNRLGGWYAYRMSKAALNMGIKNAAIETKRRNKNAVVVGFHPGTTDTKLSSPFQNNVPEGKLFTTEFAAKSLLQVLDGLQPGDSGKCFDWQGQEIPA